MNGISRGGKKGVSKSMNQVGDIVSMIPAVGPLVGGIIKGVGQSADGSKKTPNNLEGPSGSGPMDRRMQELEFQQSQTLQKGVEALQSPDIPQATKEQAAPAVLSAYELDRKKKFNGYA